MNLPDHEKIFLSALVKTSRQRPHFVQWIDRDGSDRATTFTVAEWTQLNTLARRHHFSLAELMRQAAHIPVVKERPPAPAATPAVPQP